MAADPNNETRGGCPVTHTVYNVDRPIFEHYRLLDEERERGPITWNDTTEWGFWMVNRADLVKEGLQSMDLFSTEYTNALNPIRAVDLLPQSLDGEEHFTFRRELNPFFSPAAVKRMEPFARKRARELLDELAPKGSINFVQEFALRYPTDIFLELLGLPVSDGEFFLPWVETIFAGFFGGEAERAEARRTADRIHEYFSAAVEDRSQNPRDPEFDMVTRLLQTEIDGQPIPRQDILTTCTSLMLAGLDTTRSALGYIYYFLANHHEVRRQLVQESGIAAKVAEEIIRMNPLVIQVGRRVTRDVEWHGCPMTTGDVVWLGLGSANRDPDLFEDPAEFKLERPNRTKHVAFGAGQHRCLGMHLARAELAIVLEEWHARIPDYRISEGEELIERGGQLTLLSLPLEWDVL